MSPSERTIYVIDDDEAVRDSLSRLITSDGLLAETFASANEFLDQVDPGAGGCVLADVVMPGLTGLELIEKLRTLGIDMPLILITGHANVSMAVRAMKAGAADFFEKPYDDLQLLESLHGALKRGRPRRGQQQDLEPLRRRYAALSERERQVMNLVTDGLSNKSVAERLEISPRTVEVFRANLMEKMRARSFADLVRSAILLSQDEVR